MTTIASSVPVAVPLLVFGFALLFTRRGILLIVGVLAYFFGCCWLLMPYLTLITDPQPMEILNVISFGLTLFVLIVGAVRIDDVLRKIRKHAIQEREKEDTSNV